MQFASLNLCYRSLDIGVLTTEIDASAVSHAHKTIQIDSLTICQAFRRDV